jgi:hypothetical protein
VIGCGNAEYLHPGGFGPETVQIPLTPADS